MPTNRRRRRRSLITPRIPQEAVHAYRIASRNRAIYEACVRSEACQGDGRHRCAVCAEHLDAIRTLHTALGVKPWEPGPLDVDGPEPTEVYGPSLLWWQGWPRAWELRCALEGAADAS